MRWEIPKTDWNGNTDTNGIYTGDRFNAKDFNRIKNNLEYLRNFAVKMYEDFKIQSLGKDKTPADYFYADEINLLESNLNTINTHTVNKSYGLVPTYQDNGQIMDFIELNRLESAILDIHDRLMTQAESLRRFTFNFGKKGGI